MAPTPPLTELSSAEATPSWLKRTDIWLAMGLVTILVILILPMPTWLLDMGLAISVTFAVIIMMTVLFIQKPLEFSSFPTVLLLATLLRLALNLASTRLVLGHGHEGTSAAGHVIEAFAGFVMSGNFVIGIIVFAILTVVNFVVITKGSGRIAEVAARFSLDAMPGKQMAIDADLSAGMIEEGEARKRRKELEDESSFFGSMDGAAKFVRGDAVAGLVITFINCLGGMVIGMAQKDMTFLDAANNYIRLTVGDGLVTQIPALVVSISAGLLVSKAGVSGSTDKALFGQLGGYPQALGLTSFLMGAMAILPGMPMIPFMALAALTGYMAWSLPRARAESAAAAHAAATAEKAPPPVAEEPISRALAIDLIRLELGYGLLGLVNGEPGQRMTEQIKALRRQLAQDMGFVMPAVRIQDNLQLQPSSYTLRVKELEAGRGELRPAMLLAMENKGETIALPGEATTEPIFGLAAMWIDPTYREEAMFKGYTVVDPPTVIATHIAEVIKDNMAELLGYADVQRLLDDMDKPYQKLVSDIIPSQISLGALQRVLQNLLTERVSIRDLPTILEAVSESAGHTRNLTILTEHVRARLARQICDTYTGEAGYIPLLTLSGEWEQNLSEALIGDGEDRQLALPPSRLQAFMGAVRQVFDRHALMGESPVLLVSGPLRPYVRAIIERFRPSTVVLSQNEIHPRARLKTLGQV